MKQPNNSNMANLGRLFFLTTIGLLINCQAQETVTDYDGNVYNTVEIGNQVWLKENLKSLHYSDGTEIPGVVAYDNDENMAEVYGRLYTWSAAMRNSKEEGAQGIAPDGWHIPSDAEWKELENFLGGASVAGGKMKVTGTEYWSAPNTGADNSSGFSGLPGGEYDAHYLPHIFQLLNTAAVFWTSTQVTSTKARERFLSHNTKACSKYDWYKNMKYSIRCVKNIPTDVNDKEKVKHNFILLQNYPNPFNPYTTISYSIPSTFDHKPSTIKLVVFNTLGQQVATLVNEAKSPGNYKVTFDGSTLSSGIYFYTLYSGNFSLTQKMMLIK